MKKLKWFLEGVVLHIRLGLSTLKCWGIMVLIRRQLKRVERRQRRLAKIQMGARAEKAWLLSQAPVPKEAVARVNNILAECEDKPRNGKPYGGC